MTSVRFSPELEELVEQAAAMAGETQSEFIRAASAERAAKVLGTDNRQRLGSMIGAVGSGSGSRARESGRVFADLVADKHRP